VVGMQIGKDISTAPSPPEREEEGEAKKMSRDIQHKSATQLKLNRITKAGNKKIK
jgi:hypothetical protein